MFAPTTRVLIVDDMMTMRKIVSKTLRDIGLTDIQEAADGNLAWDILCKSEPGIQLVISDWNMPNCTGLELLKRVKADPKYAKLPFVLLTAEAEAAQITEALKSGVSNYIIKPFTAEIVRQKLELVSKKVAA